MKPSGEVLAFVIWIVVPNVAVAIYAFSTMHWWEATQATAWMWLSSILPLMHTIFWVGAIGAPLLLAYQWADEKFSPHPVCHRELNDLRAWLRGRS